MSESDSPRARAAAEDAAMIKQVAGGDLSIPLGHLIDRHGPRVYAIGLEVLGGPAAAEQLVRRTFVMLWRAADRIDPKRGSVAAYVQSIARRAAIDMHDRQAPPEARPPALSEADRGAYTRLLAGLELRDALQTLPQHHREVLELTYGEQLTAEQIADRLDVPSGTAESRTQNALRSLRKLLGGGAERALLPDADELGEQRQLELLGEALRSAPALARMPDGLRERTLIAIDEVVDKADQAAASAAAEQEQDEAEAAAEVEAERVVEAVEAEVGTAVQMTADPARAEAGAEDEAGDDYGDEGDEDEEEADYDEQGYADETGEYEREEAGGDSYDDYEDEADAGYEEHSRSYRRDEFPPKPGWRRTLDSVGDAIVRSTPAQRLVAGAIALVVVVLLFVVVGGGDGGAELEGELTGEGASATITVRESGAGRAIELQTSNLPELRDNQYYELWFVGGDGGRKRSDRVSAGTFRPDPDDAEISLFAAADPRELPRIEITTERADGNPKASKKVVVSSSE